MQRFALEIYPCAYVSMTVLCEKFGQLLYIFLFLLLPLQTIANPKISIITSLYKGEKFIKGFLQDITRQTIFDQCELIIINANSPEHEEPIIREYMKKYPNIIYKKLDYQLGLYATWNMGINMARGIYITNANVDDRLSAKCYAVHARFLDANPSIDLVYSNSFITTLVNDKFEKNLQKHPRVQLPFSPNNIKKSCMPSFNPMWRKSMHDKHGLFDESFIIAGDWEMWIRAVKLGSVFKKINGFYGLFYNNHEGLSTATTNNKLRLTEETRMKKLHADFFSSRKNKQ